MLALVQIRKHIITTWLFGMHLLLFTLDASATHIVGGEIMYNYLGNNVYEITLKVYRDCGPTNINGTGFDVNASVGIYRTSNGTLYNGDFTMPLANATVDFVPVELENPCFVLPPDVCVQRAVYVKTITLPPLAGGYTLVYQRCCRNPSIVNLISPQSAGATFTTRIPGSNLVGSNNSAQFNNFPPVALCANAEFYFDHSATDADGDSLVYEFCSPLLGATPNDPAPSPPLGPPFTPVPFAAGFSASYPITSSPAFSIDPATGFMTGTATQLGQYVLGICVSEYRNGQLINTTNRDFQFNVTICDPNIVASIPDLPTVCSGAPVQFGNNSTNASFFFWDFGVPGITSDTSNLVSPTYTFPGSGPYTVTLIANPGWPCADTVTMQYQSFPQYNPSISVGQYECINDGDYYDFFATATGASGANIQWDFGAGSIPQFSTQWNPQNVKMNPEAPAMNVVFQVQQNGCTETATLTIPNPPDPVAAVAPQEEFCNGFEYAFQNLSQNALSYYWDFGMGSNFFSTTQNPVVVFPDTGMYQVKLLVTAPNTCPDSTQFSMYIYGLLDPSFPPQNSQCLQGNSFNFQGQGASTNEATYSWNFGAVANMPSSSFQNPSAISFNQSGYHPVTLTISENGCVESYTDIVWVAANMMADPEVLNASGCPELTVIFDANVTADTQIFYQWNFGDGEGSTLAQTSHTYTNTGSYDVSLTATTINGCEESRTFTLPGAVVVHPLPVANFSIVPQRVNILEPTVEITDLSLGSVACNYFTSDGSTTSECDFTYTFSEGGIQTITQYVMNEFGCVDKVTGAVVIDGFVFYAPNAFTPNYDGLNDQWQPKMLGITSYNLTIYNRWGDAIFSTDDPRQPWLGEVHEGDFFAPDGIYNYIVKLRDAEGLPHEFKGHISLIR